LNFVLDFAGFYFVLKTAIDLLATTTYFVDVAVVSITAASIVGHYTAAAEETTAARETVITAASFASKAATG
jgi:hypothetical protein